MVALNVWPTDASDGSVATEARWRKMAKFWQQSGVLRGVGSEMALTLAFPNLTVANGAGWIDGHYCELPVDSVLGVTASGLVVIRFDPTSNTAELLFRDGVTVPAQDPVGTWEMPIARISSSNVTDLRLIVRPDGSIYFPNMSAALVWAPSLPGYSEAFIASSAGYAAVNVPYVLNGGVWKVPPGTRLITQAQEVQVATTTMNGYFDVSIGENPGGIFPFATVAVLKVASIYMNCDRGTPMGAYIYSNSYTAPGSGGGAGRSYGRAPGTTTAAAGFGNLGSCEGLQTVAAYGGAPSWTVRLQGVVGGPTNFGYYFIQSQERFAL